MSGGVVAPVAADPPPDRPSTATADWWDDLLAVGAEPGEGYASPATQPARSAPAIESTPGDTGTTPKAFPAPGAAEVTLAERGVPRTAGRTPVRVSAGSGAAVGETVRVEVLDGEAAERAGVHGFVFRLSGEENTPLPAGEELPATLTVDYSGFAGASGGGYADRLQVVALPACAVADPVPADCDRTGTPLGARNDPTSEHLVVAVEDLATLQDASVASTTAEADVAVPAPTDAEGVVLAVMAGPEGVGGSYKATPFGVSGDWEVGVGSGEFSWGYDFPVLAAPAGGSPDVSLSYSSGAVDGMVSSKNTQPGAVGLGWGDFANAFIERRYNPCAQEGTALADLCWAGHNASISLNGQASELVAAPGQGTNPVQWRLKSDPRWRVERLTVVDDPGNANGDDDGEHWKVTTPDGTQYWFGIGRNPGVPTDPLVTQSTWTVPVVGDDSGEPCFSASLHLCSQGWRWNLDRVVDPNGNQRMYEYVAEVNRYRAVGGAAGHEADPYIRGGYLKTIWYGSHVDDTEDYSGKVTFDVNYRCNTLDAPGTPACVHPDEAPPGMTYPDVPMDLQCDSACVETSPTFFAKERYTGVHMCVKGRAGGACEETDYFKLSHTFSSTAEGTDDDKLFLTGIQRTGREVGATASPGDDTTLVLPPTTFSPVALANRHLPGTESLMRHWRIAKVTDEFGREVNVTYGQPHPCPDPSPSQWDLNTSDCFPQLWGPEGTAPTFRAFNKYLVTKVEVKDTTGGSPAVVTEYLYGAEIDDLVDGAPQTWEPLRDQPEAAWHHDQDPYTAQASMSWSEWRGYQDVLVKQGTTRTRYKLYRGMDDDLFQNPFPGGFRTVTVSSLDGTVTNTPDSNWLAGRVLDEMTLRPTVNTPEVGTVHSYQNVVTANVPCTPMPACETTDIRDARWVGEVDTVVRRRTQDAGIVFKKQRTQTTYNGTSFVPETVAEHGWTDVAGDERCTRTEYVTNASVHMLDYAQRVTRYDNGTACSGTAVTRTETAYDGLAVGAAPTEGNPTSSRVQTSTAPSPAGTWSTTGTEFDRFGRPRVVTDPDGHSTTTVYNDASDDLGYPYNVKVTNHLGHVSETELFLVRQAPAWSDDANDKRTTFAYDPLGRVTSVWQPTETTTGPASWAFSYDIAPNRNEVPVIRTRQLQDTPGGTPRYLDSWVLYDSLLRERQTHTPSPTAGKVIVADTVYDDRGLVQFTNVPEAVTAAPGNALAATPANGWRNSSQTAYDHVGRANWELFWADGTDPDLLANNAQRSTLTTFTHDTAVIDPLVGGNTRTTTDGLGRSTEVAEHDGTAYRATAYGYDKADRLLTVRDPANNTITYTYDLAGRRLTMNDPDAGNWSYGYDPAGNQTSVTDALSAVVHTVYDELNRPTERREDNPTTGDLLASWSYDSLGGAGAADDERGLLNSSTRVTPTGNWVVDVAGYDARNRPTGRSWTIPAGIPGLSGATPATFGPVTYGYDQADHPTTVAYPAVGGLPAETVTTSYDSFGLADTMTGAADYVSVSAYDDRARPSLFGFGTSPAFAMGKFWAYDLNQQIQTMQTSGTGGGITQSRTIGYDQAGNVTERNATLAGASAKECLGYDQRQRLTSAYTTTPVTTCASGSNKGQGANPYNHAYTYSHDGNMLTRVEGATTTSYTYPAGGAGSTRPHAPTGVGTNTYTWNANGNQATRTVAGQLNTLTWDSEHRLATVDDPDGDSSFTYDADGARLLRQTPAGTTLYIEGHEITAPTGGGPTSAVRSYGFAGQPVATRTPAGLDYLVTDNQGTLEQTIPAGSATAEHTRTYNPYGKLRTGGQPDTDHTWIGQIEDDSTGLQYLNARYYDPTTGVFTAPDPLADPNQPKSFNPYAYSWNNPVSKSDPTGLYACDDPRNCGPGRPLGNDTKEEANQRYNGDGGGGGGGGCPTTTTGTTTPTGSSPAGYTNCGGGRTNYGQQLKDFGGGAFRAAAGLFNGPCHSTAFLMMGPAECNKGPAATASALSEDGLIALVPCRSERGSALAGCIFANIILAGLTRKAQGVGPRSTRFGPTNPGPLVDDIAGTFRSRSYSEIVLQRETTLYRVHGGQASASGAFWSRTPPGGSLQAILDSALNPTWGNTAQQVAVARVPAGTMIYEGAAASQSITGGGSLLGGGSQVYVPGFDPAWLVG